MNSSPQNEATDSVVQQPPTKPQNKKLKWIFIIVVALSLVATIFFLLLKANPQPSRTNSQNTPELEDYEKNAEIFQIVEETLSPFTKEELELLGVYNLPSNYSVQHEYKEVIFTQTTNISYTPEQILILEAIIDRAPSRLLEDGPIVFVISTREDLSMGYALGVAHASGPYIFLDQDTFDLGGSWYDNSIDQIYNAIYHELVHVAQFKEIYKDSSPEELLSQTEAIDAWTSQALRTELMSSFADITGWEKKEYDYSDIIMFTLADRDAEVTTTYGKGDINEDMADTVAGVYMGKGNLFSDNRVSWAEDFLGESYEEMIIGSLPYMSELAVTKISSLPSQFSDEVEESSQAGDMYTDVLFFSSAKNESLNISDVLEYYEEQFEMRKWTKITNSKEDFDNNIARYAYEYSSGDTKLTIEFISYANAEGYIVRPPDVFVRVVREITL